MDDQKAEIIKAATEAALSAVEEAGKAEPQLYLILVLLGLLFLITAGVTILILKLMLNNQRAAQTEILTEHKQATQKFVEVIERAQANERERSDECHRNSQEMLRMASEATSKVESVCLLSNKTMESSMNCIQEAMRQLGNKEGGKGGA